MLNYFVAFDFLTAAIFILCAYHALKNHGRYRVLELFFTVLYGVLLENFMILYYNGYSYGSGFLVMLGHAPLSIAIGWSVIIYSAMEMSNRIKMNQWLRPLLDVLLALVIDLAMDPIAIRMGYWKWNLPLTEQWFGVPYGNFYGWISIIFLCSCWLRILRKGCLGENERMTCPIRKIAYLAPLSVVILSMLTMPLMFDFLFIFSIILSQMTGIILDVAQLYFMIALVEAFLIVVLLNIHEKKYRGFAGRGIGLIPLSVPLALNVFFIVAAVNLGIFSQNPSLFTISAISTVISLIVYVTPWLYYKIFNDKIGLN